MTVPFTVPITLTTRTVNGADSYGNDVYSVTTTIVQGVFAPGTSVEQLDGRDLVITQPTAYLPAATDLSALDAVSVNGVQYEVDGTPLAWPANPMTGWRSALPIEVRLKEWTG